MTSELHARLLAVASTSPGIEVCGLLVGGSRIEDIIPAANISDEPHRAFEIDPTQLFATIRAERAGGPKLCGYFHSHPAGPPIPSTADCEQAAGDGRIWLIIGQGQVTAWVTYHQGRLEPAGLVIAAP